MTFDILLLGATGFTGQLIAEYLVEQNASSGLQIGMAGRNETKGAALLQRLDLPGECWLTVDVFHEEQLARALSKTKVLINAAGPFAEYGPPVVEACIKTKTHYVDITGEPSFFYKMRNQWHEEAREKGVSVIHACGFDSIPADLGVLRILEKFEKKEGITVQAFLKTNAQFSGGTWTTAIKALIRQKDGAIKKKQRANDNIRRIPLKIHFNKTIKRWAVPMPVLDPHVVKTSAREMPLTYGSSFAYGQYFTVSSWWGMVKLFLWMGSLFFLTKFKWGAKWLLSKNKPGTGPSPEKRAQSFFQFHFLGENDSQKEELIISAGDPGYNETAKMISESALLLWKKSEDGENIPGVITPAMALGTELLDILVAKGISVS